MGESGVLGCEGGSGRGEIEGQTGNDDIVSRFQSDDKMVMEWDVQRVWRDERRWTHSRRRRDEEVTWRRDRILRVERERNCNYKPTACGRSGSFPFFICFVFVCFAFLCICLALPRIIALPFAVHLQ